MIFAVFLQLVPIILLGERKLLGRFQSRIGPNRVGPRGAFQPIADVLKLLSKEQFTPATAVPWMMAIAPVISVTTAVATMAIIPFGPYDAWGGGFGLYGIDVSIGLLYFFAFGSLAFYGLMLGGWASRLEVLVPRRDARRRAADLLRGRARPVAARRGDDRRLALARRHRRGAGQHLVHRAAVRRLLHLPGGRLRGDRARPVRPARGRRRDRRRLQHRVRRDALRLVLHGRVHGDPDHLAASPPPASSAAGTAPARWRSRPLWMLLKIMLGAALLHLGARHAAAAALRPADVVRLEGPAAAGDPERARDRDVLVVT